MTTNRSLKTGMATMALVAAVAFSGAALSPVLARAKTEDKTFTHSFRQVKADQVLDWMKKQGIEVKCQRADLPAKLMTFAFDGMGRDDLVNAFGEMVGMRAVKRGDVYTLLRSVGSDAQGEPFGSEAIDDCPLSSEELGWEETQDPQIFQFEGLDDFDFDFDMFQPMQDPGAMVEEIMKALEEAGAFSGKKLTQSEKDALKERLTERLGKLHGGMMFMGPDHFKYALPGKEGGRFFMLDPDQHKIQMEELHKHLQELEKSGHLNKEEMARAQEEVKRAMAELEKSGQLHRFTPEMLEKMKAEGQLKMLDQEHMKSLEEMQKSGRLKMLQGDKAMKSGQDAIKAAIERLQATRDQKNLTDEQRAAIDQALKELKRAMEQKTWLMPGGEGTTWLMPGGAESFKSEDYKKAMEEMHRHMADLEKNGTLKQWNGDEFKKHMEEMQKHLGENLKVMQLKLENLKKFAASLTPEQRKLHDKQGYLTPDDLTKEQRELLGIDGKSEVNFTYNNDKEKITIKSKGTEKKTGGPGQKGVVTI